MENLKDNDIVYIDLKSSKVRRQEISKEIRSKYIGGIGINAMLLMESNAAQYDALSENNLLIFGSGVIVGTGLMAGNRCVITTKSPVTGIYGDSNVGGNFNVRMRGVGIDHIVFENKADKPVYVFIDKNSEIKILDASDLWGKGTDIVTDILVERHGVGCEVACIGQGGESLVRFSSVIMSKNHAAGRMGTGCVMGSKNLKAIVIENNKLNIQIYHKERFANLRKKWLDNSKRSAISKLGALYSTLFLIEANNRGKNLPVRNFKQNYDKEAENIYPTVFNHRYKKRREACYSCPIGCSKVYEVNSGRFKGIKGSRIEFGAASLGPVLGIFDWPSILHLKLMCDKYGLDTIELGAVLSLVMESQERGLIDKAQTFGKEVKFGSVDDAELLINKLVERDGIGDLLAEGTYRAGKALGVEEYAFCINKSSTGLQTNKRLVRSLGYITSTRGGDHLKSFAFTMQNGGYFISKHIFGIKKAQKRLDKPEDIGRVLWWHENYKIIVDSIGVCLFAIQGLPSLGVGLFDDFAEVMNSMFNTNLTEKDVFCAAERIYQLQNTFSVSCGLAIDDYKWPIRKADEDVDKEYLQNSIIEVRDEPGMLPEYFKYRGLSKDGKPTKERFLDLNIEEYIDHQNTIDTEDVSNMNELLKTVKLTIKFNFLDRIYVKIACFMMDKLFQLKEKVQTKQLIKKEEKERQIADSANSFSI